jgi:hypothetical protein
VPQVTKYLYQTGSDTVRTHFGWRPCMTDAEAQRVLAGARSGRSGHLLVSTKVFRGWRGSCFPLSMR